MVETPPLAGSDPYEVLDPRPLARAIRDGSAALAPRLGPKVTVIVDGKAGRSCVLPWAGMSGRNITTLEGLGSRALLHPVQQAFIEEQAAQCGYCLNGMIMTTKALLDRNPTPSDEEIRRALAANLCRCGTHLEILKAVQRAVQLCRECPHCD
ncbi:Nicotinate dehydrogenase subunit A [compost metagenome]